MYTKSALVLLAISLIGCGIPPQIAKSCSGDLEQGCRTIFGTVENDELQSQVNAQTTTLEAYNQELLNQIATERERNNNQDVLIQDLSTRVSNTESSINVVESNLVVVQSDLLALYTITATQTATNATQAAQIAALQSQQASMQAQILALQAQAVSAQASITTLQMQDSVVDYLDCGGNGPGFDEVVLRTKSGKLVAYFESGSNRFLSILTPGNYQTTDASHCPFTVNNAGQFCDSLGCR
jgi:hypothetical protein